MISDTYIETIPKLSSCEAPEYMTDGNWLVYQIQYAQLCADITVRTYDDTSDKEPGSRDLVLDEVQNRLHAWKSSLPVGYSDLDQVHPLGFDRDGRKLELFCQYHDAIFAIHRAWDEEEIRDHKRLASNETCLRSARTILDLIMHIPVPMVTCSR